MDNNKILFELLGAMKALHESKITEAPILYSIGNIWTAVSEICGIKIAGPFNENMQAYILERLSLVSFVQEDSFDHIIEFLTTTKIEMKEDSL
jgi:hypothetical protein